MSTRQDTALSPPISSRNDLVAWLAAGEKPEERWRIGTEHEKFIFDRTTLAPVSYDGAKGIRTIMIGLVDRFGWEPIREGDTIIALAGTGASAGATISLEPGGQFELSGAPLRSLHEVAEETDRHLAEVAAVTDPLDLGMLGMGFTPTWSRAEMPTMPKRRYAVMTRYMPKVGQHGLDMMYRTCTIQVNLDYASEADMVQKLRVSLALQPIAQAMFAASPFTEGAANGFKTFRGEVWRDTDRARTGNLPFAFEAQMGYERYVDYALNVPMYFVYRDGHYIDVAGASFQDFLAGRLAAMPGERPTMADWSDHLTTLFPDVRLKKFLEMRGADGGPASRIKALPAYWVGLLYDQGALDAAWQMVKVWSAAERDQLRDGVPRHGMALPFRNGTVADLARETLALARQGLKNRALRLGLQRDETCYLEPMEAMARQGACPADLMLADLSARPEGEPLRLYHSLRITD